MDVPILRSVLDHGERQLWVGTPRRGIVLRASDALLIPFSLMWGGFAVFWETTAVRHGAPTIFVLWGIPFVLMGVYLVIGRFFIDAARRAHTTYAVTNDRIIIEVDRIGPLPGSTRSLSLRTLGELQLRERGDGTGTITFGSQPFGGLGAGASWPGSPQLPAFDVVPDARRVYDVIREAQRTVT